MSKKYLFSDLTVGTNGAFQPNATEFFSKALLGDNRSTNSFRTLVNVKNKTRIGSVEFGSVLSASSPTFAANGVADVASKEFTVIPLNIGTEIDQYTLESSFVSQWMRAGSNQIDFGPAQFMTHYYERLAAKVSDSLEYLTWIGNTGGTGSGYTGANAYLTLADGLEKQLKAANEASALAVASPTTITASNVIDELGKVITKLPAALKYRKNDVVIKVAADVAQLYELAASKINTNTTVTQSLGLVFQGYKIEVAPGMTSGKMVASLATNFVFVTDLVGDPAEIITLNMKEQTGDRTIRTISDIKWCVGYINPAEIVTYNFG